MLADKPRFPPQKTPLEIFGKLRCTARMPKQITAPMARRDTEAALYARRILRKTLPQRDSLTAAVDKPNRESKARLSPSVNRFAHGAHGRRLADALRFPRSRAAATGCILGFGPTERDLRRRSSTDARAGRNEWLAALLSKPSPARTRRDL